MSNVCEAEASSSDRSQPGSIGTPLWRAHRQTVEKRLADLCAERGLVAIAAFGPENVYYVSGYPSRALYRYPLAGRALAAFIPEASPPAACVLSDFEAPAVPEISGIAVHTFPTWMDIDDPFDTAVKAKAERPSDFQSSSTFGVLNEALRAAGATMGTIGVDPATVSMSAWTELHEANPGFEFVDVGADLFRLRSHKTPWEIDCLRAAATTGERALNAITGDIRPGVTEADLVRAYRIAVDKDPICDKVGHVQVLVGPRFAPTYLPETRPAEAGALIELDVGTEIAAYASDLARTFSLGEPTAMVKRIYAALRNGHDHLLEMVAPGVPMQAIYQDATDVIHKSGLKTYNRGHLGHSIGLDVRVEEPPVVGPREQTILEPGMVLCVETPYYGHGLGGISIEDMVLVTETGNQNLITLSRDLQVV